MEITNGEITYGKVRLYAEKEVFYLDHQCDDWVIGDIKEAKKFAEDLLKTIKEVEDKNTEPTKDNG